MTQTEFGLEIASLILKISAEILEKFLQSGDIQDLRIKDLKAWREWETRTANPNFKKLLDEYRKKVRR